MRFLLALLLPITVLAQGLPVGNPNGVILGVFAMCGTNPVDCGNGWCCLAGQTCVSGSRGDNTMCNDPVLTDGNGNSGVTVNAAYFGKLQDHQSAIGTNGTTLGTSKSQQSNEAPSSRPAIYILISAFIGTSAILLGAL